MNEGSLEAPARHIIPWRDEDFYDIEKLDLELRRTFDICHGCRRCFNLCDSFPRLFDLIDDSKSGELDAVSSNDFKPIIDACTLCDMCFMSKCPYVPPHHFNLDFPHLILRARAVEARETGVSFVAKQLTKTDRNGKLAAPISGLANWASKRGNSLTRPFMQVALGVHKDAELPRFESKPFSNKNNQTPNANIDAPAYGRKAILYATCFATYNNSKICISVQSVLAHNGVETEIVYPKCCGMPQLEQGDIVGVAATASDVAKTLKPWIDRGYDVIALVPSCALMLKSEWPLIIPENDDVQALSKATFDITEYIVNIGKNEGLIDGLQPLSGGVCIHISCHSRAQNMGQKGTEMLRLIPDTDVDVIERCSGHGGSWGVMEDNFEVALKIGKPVARKVAEKGAAHIVSECPLARDHILQGVERINKAPSDVSQFQHPIQLIALAYGL
jgi:glycerol-3-phosphate dehydrogenase subunit C